MVKFSRKSSSDAGEKLLLSPGRTKKHAGGAGGMLKMGGKPKHNPHAAERSDSDCPTDSTSKSSKPSPLFRKISSLVRKNSTTTSNHKVPATPETAPSSPTEESGGSDCYTSNLDIMVVDNHAALSSPQCKIGSYDEHDIMLIPATPPSGARGGKAGDKAKDDHHDDVNDGDSTISNLTESVSAMYSPGIQEFYKEPVEEENTTVSYTVIAETVYGIMEQACNINSEPQAEELKQMDLTSAVVSSWGAALDPEESVDDEEGDDDDGHDEEHEGHSGAELSISAPSRHEELSNDEDKVRSSSQEQNVDDNINNREEDSDANVVEKDHRDGEDNGVIKNEEIELVLRAVSRAKPEEVEAKEKEEEEEEDTDKSSKKWLKRIRSKQHAQDHAGDATATNSDDSQAYQSTVSDDLVTRDMPLRVVGHSGSQHEHLQLHLDSIKEESEGSTQREEQFDSNNNSNNREIKSKLSAVKKNIVGQITKRVPSLKKRSGSNNNKCVFDTDEDNIILKKSAVPKFLRVDDLLGDEVVLEDIIEGEEMDYDQSYPVVKMVSSSDDIIKDLSLHEEVRRMRSAPIQKLKELESGSGRGNDSNGGQKAGTTAAAFKLKKSGSNKKPLWKAATDPNTGRMYYYHRITRKTTWHRPPDLDLVLVQPEVEKKINKKHPPQNNLNHTSEKKDDYDEKKEEACDDDYNIRKTEEKDAVLLQTKKQIQDLILNSSIQIEEDDGLPPSSQKNVTMKANNDAEDLKKDVMKDTSEKNVQNLLEEFEGREKQLLHELKELADNKPFDEPVAISSPSRRKTWNNSGGAGPEEMTDHSLSSATINSLAFKKNTLPFVRTGFSTSTKMSYLTETTQKIGNTAANKRILSPGREHLQQPSSSLSSPYQNNNHHHHMHPSSAISTATSISSIDEDEAATTREGVGERIPSKIVQHHVPRERDLKVEEFPSDRLSQEIYNYDNLVVNGSSSARRRGRLDSETEIEVPPTPSICETEDDYSYYGDYDENTTSKLEADSISAISSLDEHDFIYGHDHPQHHRRGHGGFHDARRIRWAAGHAVASSIGEQEEYDNNRGVESNHGEDFLYGASLLSSSAEGIMRQVKEAIYENTIFNGSNNVDWISGDTKGETNWANSDWKKAELEVDRLINENDWDSVSKYISKIPGVGNLLGGMGASTSHVETRTTDPKHHHHHNPKSDFQYPNSSGAPGNQSQTNEAIRTPGKSMASSNNSRNSSYNSEVSLDSDTHDDLFGRIRHSRKTSSSQQGQSFEC